MYKKYFYVIFILITVVVNAQQKRIQIIHADNSIQNEEKYPGATILLGNVFIEHEGFTLRSKKAIHYRQNNILKAFGDVVLNQGDTISQTSTYVEYNGNSKKAVSWGNVILKDQLMTLSTDTLFFNRKKQLLYYHSGATIKDDENILTSKLGNYYLENSKFMAESDVVITNPEYVLESNHLDYYTNNGQAFLYGPSTITSKDNKIYTEKGFYDTKINVSHFTKNSKIEYNDRTITADSLYYDRNTGFASATKNIIIKDTTNHSVIKGNYAELFQKQDSAFVVGRAVAITEIEKDSMFIHGDTLLITGQIKKRIVRAFPNVKFFKSDLSGKCDSLHSNQVTGLTQLIRNPVLWSQESQITGDSIHLISNPKTEKLDSLKVLKNVFIIQKDSVGYNQIKGRNLFGKFIDNDLQIIDIIGNAESIFYVRDDTDNSLIGIDKATCSTINIRLKDNKILSTKCNTQPTGDTNPPSKFPENARKFRGFIWREDERPLTKDAIFNTDKKSKPKSKSKNNIATPIVVKEKQKKEVLGIDKKLELKKPLQKKDN